MLGSGPWLPRGHTGVTTEEVQGTHTSRSRGATGPHLTYTGPHFQEAVLKHGVSRHDTAGSKIQPTLCLGQQ